MKKTKPTKKPKILTPIESPVGLPQVQNMPFHEFVRRLVRVTPQEVKIKKG
jgi:hypothetical protein